MIGACVRNVGIKDLHSIPLNPTVIPFETGYEDLSGTVLRYGYTSAPPIGMRTCLRGASRRGALPSRALHLTSLRVGWRILFSAPSTVQRRALSSYRQVSAISRTRISTRALRRMSLLRSRLASTSPLARIYCGSFITIVQCLICTSAKISVFHASNSQCLCGATQTYDF